MKPRAAAYLIARDQSGKALKRFRVSSLDLTAIIMVATSAAISRKEWLRLGGPRKWSLDFSEVQKARAAKAAEIDRLTNGPQAGEPQHELHELRRMAEGLRTGVIRSVPLAA